MLRKIKEFIISCNMLEQGDTAVCGLSGGADSVSLLLALLELSEELGITVEALHVNHCLRGEESDRDQEFCRMLCQRLNVPFTAFSCDVKSFAKENSLSCEDAARKLRYGIFAEHTAGKKLAAAHNADDNLETVILNLIRGTALKGLAGIPPVRGNIIRPLLTVSRREIEEFLHSREQNYVTDSTNLSDDYTRNRIRHHIIPIMKVLNSSVIDTSVRSIGLLRSEDQLIESETDSAWEKCFRNERLTGLAEFPEVVRRRCISRLLSAANLPYSGTRLAEADRILLSGGKMNVSGDLFLIGHDGELELKRLTQTAIPELSAELVIGENRIFPDCALICQVVTPEESGFNCDRMKKVGTVHKKLTFYLIDYDKIIGRAIVRNRRFGDRLQLSGRSFTSSVKKLINETVPAPLRPTLHFIEDEGGTIFAERIGIAERVAPGRDTARLLKITVKKYTDWS